MSLNKLSPTEAILKEICEKHGITLTQGREAFDLWGKFINIKVSGLDREIKEDGIFKEKEFIPIHLTNIGKLLPQKTMIYLANNAAIKKRTKTEE